MLHKVFIAMSHRSNQGGGMCTVTRVERVTFICFYSSVGLNDV